MYLLLGNAYYHSTNFPLFQALLKIFIFIIFILKRAKKGTVLNTNLRQSLKN